MATEGSPQRAWRAACPNCGAPVAFASAASASAVCSFCQSTLLREGDVLKRIGTAGELFDDHSPLQLGVNGRYQGAAFNLVGRLQYGYEGGTWNEWHALFDNGRSGWLSEDNGAYVLAFDSPPQGSLPSADALVVGQRCVVDGRAWDVASATQARLISAQGELPRPPRLEQAFAVVELRNAAGEVGSIDYTDAAWPSFSTGRSVALSELALQGLKEGSEASLKGRSVGCPSCGASLAITLQSTQSVGCGQCHAVVALNESVDGELRQFRQASAPEGGIEPQLPLGITGNLALEGVRGGQRLAWQVVGFMERCTLPGGGDDEQYFWREYLLYNQTEGFLFLVDSDEGWSWSRPLTGAPTQRGSQVQWQGRNYMLKEHYGARTTWVLGEFYWRVQAGERVQVADYAGQGRASNRRLSREQTQGGQSQEVTWSEGATLEGLLVATAFKVPAAQLNASKSPAPNVMGDAAAAVSGGLSTMVVLFVVLAMVIMAVAQCSHDECDDVRATFGEASAEYQQCKRSRGSGVRSSGGSWGGGHK